MKKIDIDIKEAIKSKLNIVDVISEYIDLKKKGKDYKGLCPFHVEKTPSFSVVENDQYYYCFGCGASGDVIQFVMEYESLGFYEALEYLANKAGIQLSDEKEENREYVTLKLFNRIMELYNKTNRTYVEKFMKERALSLDLIDLYKIGYCDCWDSYKDQFNDKEKEILTDVGIINEFDDKIYSFFSNRIVFPIIHGRYPIGFAGRRTKDNQKAKYINLKKSYIYDKSSSLFGLSLAKKEIRKTGQVNVVEGYTDQMSLWVAGMKNTVAVCGTAFTRQHARMLSRMAKSICFINDGDSAGIKSAYNSVLTSLKQGIVPYVVKMPTGEDPNSMLKNLGPKKMNQYINENKEVFYKHYGKILKNHPIEKKIRFVKDATMAISEIVDDVVRGLMNDDLKSYFNLSSRISGRKVQKKFDSSVETIYIQTLAYMLNPEHKKMFYRAFQNYTFSRMRKVFKYVMDHHDEKVSILDLERRFPEYKEEFGMIRNLSTTMTKETAVDVIRRVKIWDYEKQISKLNIKMFENPDQETDIQNEIERLRMEINVLSKVSTLDPPLY